MDIVQKVWNQAATLKGRNPEKVRKDPYLNQIHRHAYNQNIPHGWTIDYIVPKKYGGVEKLSNMQAMEIKLAAKKEDDLIKKNRHNQ